MTRCSRAGCRNDFEQPAEGRTREFCSNACRARHWRQNQADAEATMLARRIKAANVHDLAAALLVAGPGARRTLARLLS